MQHNSAFTPEAIASIIEQLRTMQDITITEIRDEPEAVRVIGILQQTLNLPIICPPIESLADTRLDRYHAEGVIAYLPKA
jgi:hypothetical protein